MLASTHMHKQAQWNAKALQAAANVEPTCYLQLLLMAGIQGFHPTPPCLLRLHSQQLLLNITTELLAVQPSIYNMLCLAMRCSCARGKG
jgi:hypothetical protein